MGEVNENKNTLSHSHSSSSSSEDRLSNLPEELIHHILSFMETDDACKTRTLSRRWRSLWTTIPDFSFYHNEKNHPRDDRSRVRKRFQRFLNKFLDSRKPHGIRKFHLHVDDTSCSSFKKWIRDVIQCGAQEIELHLCLKNIQQPLGVFRSQTLTVLKLNGDLSFRPSPAPWLPSLKFLFLNIESFDEELVQTLLAACPALEEFDINGYYQLMKIFSLSLNKLTTTIHFGSTPARFELDAPSLEYISLSTYDRFPVEYAFKNLANVINAQLFMLVQLCNLGCLFDLLKGLSNVRSLYFSAFIYEEDTTKNHRLVPCIKKNHHHILPEFSNLVRLRFGEVSDLDLLPSFLQNSPKLQVLVIERHDLVDVIWTKPREVPGCLSSCLAHFTYKGFLGMKEEVEIVEYIVRNSSVLKTVTIQPSLAFKNKLGKERIRIYGELTRLSELSKPCQFIFEQKPFHSDEEYCHHSIVMDIVKRSYMVK